MDQKPPSHCIYFICTSIHNQIAAICFVRFLTAISCKWCLFFFSSFFCWIIQFIKSILLLSDLRWHHPMVLCIASEENRIFMSQTHIMSLMTIQFNTKFQSNRTFFAGSTSLEPAKPTLLWHSLLLLSYKNQCDIHYDAMMWHQMKMRNKLIWLGCVRCCFVWKFLESFKMFEYVCTDLKSDFSKTI